MTVYVFTGPTLSPEEGRAELDALYLPPVSQGDVYRTALRKPQMIGIIDGYFDHVPAVWHKEILWAMSQGIHVYGSASMGALRAAELAEFGMEGIGEIFEAYYHGVLEDDDDVAVVHGPAETGYRPGSEAMVNIQRTLAAAERTKVINPSTRMALTTIAKDLFYPERSYPLVLQRGAKQGLPAVELSALYTWLPHGQVNQKRADALAMLRAMQERLRADPAPKSVSFTLENTVFWDHVLSSTGVVNAEGDSSGTIIEHNLLLEELRHNGNAYARARTEAIVRHLMLGEARRQGYTADTDLVRKTAREFRRRRGLLQPEKLVRWLEENYLTREQFDALMQEEAVLELARASLGRDWLRRLPDHLRLTGEYRRLLKRAQDKQRMLEAHGLKQPELKDAGTSAEELLEWYLQKRPPHSIEEDIRGYAIAAELARTNIDEFMHTVLREFLYLRLQEQSIPNTISNQ